MCVCVCFFGYAMLENSTQFGKILIKPKSECEMNLAWKNDWATCILLIFVIDIIVANAIEPLKCVWQLAIEFYVHLDFGFRCIHQLNFICFVINAIVWFVCNECSIVLSHWNWSNKIWKSIIALKHVSIEHNDIIAMISNKK